MTWYDCVSKNIQVGKRVPVNFKNNSIYFPSQYVQNLNVVATWEFDVSYKIIRDSNIYKKWENYSQICCPFHIPLETC